MTRSMRLMGAVAAAALALAAAAAAAPGGPGGRGRGPGGRGFGPMSLLDLTEEQETAFQNLLRQHREETAPIRERHQALRQQVREALDTGADAARVGQLMIQAHGVRGEMKTQRERLDESFAALLTPEQKETWTKMKAAREKDRGRRGRGFRRGGPGPGFGPPDPEDDEE